MRLISHVLLRAPLLPVSALALADPLGTDPLGAVALRIASPTLVSHADARASEARRRYGRRAAFRATPSGLLSGVAMARLVDGPSRIALGRPEAHLGLRYARVAALGRALLDTPAGWKSARLRVAPSLLRDQRRLAWLAFGEEAEARRMEAELEPPLDLVLDLCAGWIAASRLVSRLRDVTPDPEVARAFLLELVDDGLLHHDLDPPLVGPAPLRFAQARYASLCPQLEVTAALCARSAPLTEPALLELGARLAALPGASDEDGVQATLLHRGVSPLEVARAPLERAAALAPLLFALGEALSPPVEEALLTPGLDEALAAASQIVGEGRVSLAALELGHYGGMLAESDASPRQAPDLGVQSWLGGLVVAAARAGADEIELAADELARRLGPGPRPVSFELQLTPCTSERAEGYDWLLGVHAPAGATWGRFAHALGAPMVEALRELHQGEQSLDDAALRVDVAYAPSRAFADLCTTPALRDAALALSSWPADGAVVPAQCAIGNEPMGPAHRALVVEDRALIVSPLFRVRSSTAPPSAARVLLADTFLRQHAPWALPWAQLASLPWLPRVRLAGFVIAPQSWALPGACDEAALRSWRAESRAPRFIMVGSEDVLLPIDLDDAADRAALAALPAEERTRAYEIWPPLGRELDRGGRRVELVCAALDEQAAAAAAAGHARIEALAMAPPPSVSPPRAGWRTLRIYAPRDRQERVLLEWIAPFVSRQPSLQGWYFLPYVEEGTGREHLRVRLGARDEASGTRLASALWSALQPAISLGEVVAVEIAAYHPEQARFGKALPAVERIFESDAALIIDLLAEDAGLLPREALLAAGFDALARGLGLPPDVVERRCGEALAAYQIPESERREQLAPGYRVLQRPLLELLAAPSAALRDHSARVRAARLPRRAAEALLPTLLHLASVRMCGADRDAEVRALYLWSRALESRRARLKAPLARSGATRRGARPRSRRS